MKTTPISDLNDTMEMLPEYEFDYTKAKPNRFAQQTTPITVTLDADVAQVFTTSEAVNKTLRAILTTIQKTKTVIHGNA